MLRRRDSLLRNPITGSAGCCARATSHAAAPHSSVMNARPPPPMVDPVVDWSTAEVIGYNGASPIQAIS
jgi:hypothetical protein